MLLGVLSGGRLGRLLLSSVVLVLLVESGVESGADYSVDNRPVLSLSLRLFGCREIYLSLLGWYSLRLPVVSLSVCRCVVFVLVEVYSVC